MNEKDCRRLVRGFQANLLIPGEGSGIYGLTEASREELRFRRWWPPRSGGRFTIPPCIYAERASLTLMRHAHPLTQVVLKNEIGLTGSQLGEYRLLSQLGELGYLTSERVGRRHEYALVRPYKAPLYRAVDDQAPWWEVLEEPERQIITIGLATSHGPEHWKKDRSA